MPTNKIWIWVKISSHLGKFIAPLEDVKWTWFIFGIRLQCWEEFPELERILHNRSGFSWSWIESAGVVQSNYGQTGVPKSHLVERDFALKIVASRTQFPPPMSLASRNCNCLNAFRRSFLFATYPRTCVLPTFSNCF